MKQLYYKTKHLSTSDKIPVVLLHGFLESGSMWDHISFPVGYPTVSIDLPGHGKSNFSEITSYTMNDMAVAIMTILDDLKLSEVHVIGHSMGGYVALELKKNDPRAKKIMLLNSNFWTDSPQKVVDRNRVAEIVKTNKAHFIYEVIPNLFLNPQRFDNEVKLLIHEAMDIDQEVIGLTSIGMSIREDFTDLVLQNDTDFTAVQGIEDRVVDAEKMRSALSASNVNYIELESVGHMAHLEASERLNAIVGTFLK